jgi:hypothetical protein
MTAAMTPTPTPATAATEPAPSPNGKAAIHPFDIHAPGAIQNRSPMTHNHYYNATPPVAPGPVIIEPPAPAPAQQPVKPGISPWWLLLLIPLLIGGAALAWYLLKPTAPPATTTPPNWQANPTVILRDVP